MQQIVRRAGALAFVFVGVVATTLAANTFKPLGNIDSKGTRGTANAISSDGKMVVGSSVNAAGYDQAFKWTALGGMVAIGPAPASIGANGTYANAVSSDGSIVAGTELTSAGFVPVSFGNTLKPWPTVPGSVVLASIADDGVSGVGYANVSGQGSLPLRWDASGVHYFTYGQSTMHGNALSISADGQRAIGYTSGGSGYVPFTWTTQDGVKLVPPISNDTRGQAVSRNGLCMAVIARDTTDTLVFSGPNFTKYVNPPEDFFPSAISDDGDVVVGTTSSGKALLYSSRTGFVYLQTYLSAHNVDLQGCVILSAAGLSADGRTVCGQCQTSSGAKEPYVATVDYPTMTAFTMPAQAYGGTLVPTTVQSTDPAPGTQVYFSWDHYNDFWNGYSWILPTGTSTIQHNIQTVGVAAPEVITVHASYYGINLVRQLKLVPAPLYYVGLKNVQGGSTFNGAVYLAGWAPAGGASVNLSSDSSVAGVPASVTVPEKQGTAAFPVHTKGVDQDTLVHITATYGGVSKSGTITVLAPKLMSVTVGAPAVVGGNFIGGHVHLSATAGPSGYSVQLSNLMPSYYSMPSTVTIPPGSSTASFPIKTLGVDGLVNAQVGATDGGATYSAMFQILPATVASFTAPSVIYGSQQNLPCSVKLNGAAGPSGVTLSVYSSSSLVDFGAGFLTIPGGGTNAFFVMNTQSTTAAVQIQLTASASGKTVTRTLTLNPLVIISAVVSPGTIAINGDGSLNITFNGSVGTGTVTLSLFGDDQYITVPQQVTVPANSSFVSVPISVAAGESPGTKYVYISYNNTTVNVGFTVQ